MSESKSPIDPRDLDALRVEQAPDAATRVRVRSRLAAFLPTDGHWNAGENPPVSNARLRGSGGATAFASHAKTAMAFVIGGVVGAALYVGLATPPPVRVIYVDRPVVAPAPSTPDPGPTSSGVVQPWPTAIASAAPRSPSARSHASQLSEERILLDEARAAISRGDAQRGLERLDRHRRLFQNALLAEERDALLVQALVGAGRYDEARARADAFRKRTPGSLFVPAVDAAIDSIP